MASSARGTTGEGPYLRVIGQAAGVAAALVAIALLMVTSRTANPEPEKRAVVTSAPVPRPKPPRSKPRKTPVISPVVAPPAKLEIDQAAVAKSEAELAEAERAKAAAEARAVDASMKLQDAKAQAEMDAEVVTTLAERVKAPSERADQAAANGGFLKAETERLKGEIATYAQAPRPKATILSNKNPVARPADNSEHHFELRRDRVTYIDLDKMIALVKKDVTLRIRLADGARTFESRVGPVGAFSLQYEFRKMAPLRMEDLMDRRSISYKPSGWEIVPEFEGRGETFDATRRPISDYARVINRLTPGRATITFWVYPDSFDLYRKLRDDLQGRGYLVAGRPLPEGMPIRGGPGGSVSAGQ